MSSERITTHLGFSKDSVPIGTHSCVIYSSETQRREILSQFVLAGIRQGERTTCYSSKVTDDDLRTLFSNTDFSYDTLKSGSMITLIEPSHLYLKAGAFDPDPLLENLTGFHQSTLAMGIPAARVIGEMSSDVSKIPGGQRLTEYESRVNLVLMNCPMTTVCQYNAADFDKETLMEIVKVHPHIILNNTVTENPYYIPPQEYLGTR